jgi:DNA-binding IclR family transcriptional regulator
MGQIESRYIIQSVSRALDLLNLLGGNEAGMSLTEICQCLSLRPASAFKLLATLEAHDYVQKNPHGGRYFMGVASVQLGLTVLRANNIREIAVPILKKLRDDCKETVHLASLTGTRVIYLERLDSLMPVGYLHSHVGMAAPAHCTALGKAIMAFWPSDEIRRAYAHTPLVRLTPKTITDIKKLLAELDRTRKRGYAVDNEEAQLTVKCLAVPLQVNLARPTWSISVTGPAERIDRLIAKNQLASMLKMAAKEISDRIAVVSRETAAEVSDC